MTFTFGFCFSIIRFFVLLSTLLLFGGFIYLEHGFLFVFFFDERNAAYDKYSHEALGTSFLYFLTQGTTGEILK